MARYRKVGRQLGDYIRLCDPSTKQLQAYLSDFLAGDDLLLPMQDAVARPLFHALRPFAGTGGGEVQRDACLGELARSYLPKVVEEVGELIAGLLEQTQSFTPPPNHQHNPVSSQVRNPDPWGEPERISTSVAGDAPEDLKSIPKAAKQLGPSEICDENLWNQQRDPEKDKAFLKAWNLRWFNKRYRPRLEQD
jgi:hypothetical protein